MALYVKFAQEKKPRTVREFLKKYYSIRVDPYVAYGGPTFKNPECTVLHCSLSYRSFDDLLTLVNTYYPSIKPKKLMHYLLTIKFVLQGGAVAQPNIGVCGTMGRIRFLPYKDLHYDQSQIDRVMPNSQWTWKQLFAMIGINDEAEFRAYIKNNREL